MSVRVIARIRPLLPQERDIDTIVTAAAPHGHTSNNTTTSSPSTLVRIPNPRNPAETFTYSFSSVYESSTTQQALFDAEVAPTIRPLFRGSDVTLFAYGVTGTGKTHTMRGGKTLMDRGVIPRLLSAIFRRARKVEKDSDGKTMVEVRIGYYEIYCDKVFDLLVEEEERMKRPAGLSLRESGTGGRTVVVGLSEHVCGNLKEFELLYDEANAKRRTAGTKLNAHSSRSHAILSVKINQISTAADGSTTAIESTASAIDLAGSEDNRRTENDKERLVESSAINKSLFALAQCVEALMKKSARIPYRESKMTRILNLGNQNGLMVMILNLASVRSYHLDTVQSLSFASRAKTIEIRDTENEPVLRGPPARQGHTATGPSGPATKREPLKQLSHGAANVGFKSICEDTKKASKPVKSFPVYRTSGSRDSLKRPLAGVSTAARPAKVARPAANQPDMSRANLEDLVNRLVEEKLASRALDATAPPSVPVSDEVQRRLNALESRIEHKEGGRAEGLQYLLMGKQHQVRGEDASALRMYQLALPFFPNNEKLGQKMLKVQERLRLRREADQKSNQAAVEAVSSSANGRLAPLHHKPALAQNDQEEADGDYHYESDEDFEYRAPCRKPKTSYKIKVLTDKSNNEDSPLSPRSQQLLEIINSRDLTQIRTLKGVGIKRAEAIVSALCDMDDGRVTGLEQLGNLRGVSAKSVLAMRDGLVV